MNNRNLVVHVLRLGRRYLTERSTSISPLSAFLFFIPSPIKNLNRAVYLDERWIWYFWMELKVAWNSVVLKFWVADAEEVQWKKSFIVKQSVLNQKLHNISKNISQVNYEWMHRSPLFGSENFCSSHISM